MKKNRYRMKKRLTLYALALLLGCQLTSVPATVQAADSGSVKVSLPSFPVQINGVLMDPKKAQYPPIVYKDITYFPLTWDYTRTLGLTYTWSEADGLRIDSFGMRNQERPASDTSGNNKNKSYLCRARYLPCLRKRQAHR
ncbi:hypothetical protein LJK88_41585 [Paenibacillus sp. P26]|nr:hypothetical protein LJK88_41585 [Paenibacillus sp. P26]UUZ92711.1 hypothetical protein LJK87_46715 [Paenibacillus sp. P25]